MRRAALAGMVASVACMLGACGDLGSFLYAPLRTDRYVFDPDGGIPLDIVTADRIEPVMLTTEDGLSLGAVYVRSNTTPPRGYALFFHGRRANIDSDFQHSKEISNLGYDVLAVDYRGWGISSDVPPTEDGIDKDTRAARDWLIQRAGGTDRLFYYGVSLGTGMALQRAQQDTIQALVLESAFTSVEGLVRDSSLLDVPGGFVVRDSWNNVARIHEVHVPVLLIHGLSDTLLRPEFSRVLYENANEPKQLVLVENAGHGQLAHDLGDGYISLVNGFLHQYIAPIE